MAPINPHDAASACGIEAVVNSCGDPSAGRYPHLIALSLDDSHAEIRPRRPTKRAGPRWRAWAAYLQK